MAKKLNIRQDSGRLEINYNWRSPAMWFMVVWCFIWDIAVFSILFTDAGFFIGFHLLAGVFVTYFTLTRFLNSTTITVDRSALKIDHGPLPWPFAKKHVITSRSLKQLYVDKSNVKRNNKHTYALQAILDTGAEVTLINSEPDLSTVHSLERTIEGFLEIENDASLSLTARGKTPKELTKMLKGVQQMREATEQKKWVPEFIKERLHEQEKALQLEMEAYEGTTPSAPRRGANAPASSPLDADGPVTINTGRARPKPLPAPDHDFTFPLYAQRQGKRLIFNGRQYTIGRTAQIDWTDEHATTARQLELVPLTGGSNFYVYTQVERERWTYFEERRLDDDEAEALGFTGSGHPLRFNNGTERYYPRDLQSGTRFIGAGSQIVIQYIYFTTSSSTQFRALQPDGRRWEVYVMEPVDGGNFEAVQSS